MTFRTMQTKLTLATVITSAGIAPSLAAERLDAIKPPEICANGQGGGCYPLGSWVNVDMSVRYRPGLPSPRTTLPFIFWVHDPSGFIGPDEAATFQFRGVQYRHKRESFPPDLILEPGPTGNVFGAAPETLVHTGSSNDLNLGAHLPSYSNWYESSELPVYTWLVTASFNAGSFKYVGIQAGTVGVCTNGQVTALPSGPIARIVVENQQAIGACILRLRLCSTRNSPIFREADSCDQYRGKDDADRRW